MIKEIKYRGYTAIPSDYSCPDGDLATSFGVIEEEGALKALLPPADIMELEEGAAVLFIHKTSGYRHYIIRLSESLVWVERKDDTTSPPATIPGTFSIGDITGINAIGNTLLIFLPDSILYYLWKEGAYTLLGDHLPHVQLSFGLKGRPLLYSVCGEKPSTFKVTFDDIAESDILLEWPKDIQSKITSQVMAKLNKFLADQSVNKGRFCLPFLLRYALRLYDGSLVCHSAPILMNPSTKAAPVVLWNRISGSGKHGEAECDIMLVSASIDFCPYDLDGLQDWTDIVKSVDVFISKPIYGYDQNGLCTSFKESGDLDTKFIGTMDVHSLGWGTGHVYGADWGIDWARTYLGSVYEQGNVMPVYYAPFLETQYLEWKYSELYTIYYSKDRTYPNTSIRLPEFSEEKLGEQIRNVHDFYFLHSITIDDLKQYSQEPVPTNQNLDIVVPDDYLQSLLVREVMTDDYLTNDSLVAEYSHAYNSRLNLAGIRRKLFPGFSPACLFARTTIDPPSLEVGTDGRLDITYPFDKRSIDTYIDVFIRENGETYRVSAKAEAHYMAHYLSVTRYPSEKDEQLGTNAFLLRNSWGCYVFYPNVNAFRMRITDNLGSLDIDLKPHDFLNAAYALLDYDLERTPKTTETTVTASANIIDTPNKIYTSEVNNPFFFPLSGINTVGTGRILGISSAVKALSEGQFGQFPLYAFTDEGVWALEVSNTGTYSAKQPVTRDVCINPRSITQIDSAVLFATRRGIMHISGSQTVCITDSINLARVTDEDHLPVDERMISLYNAKAHAWEQLTPGDTVLMPFLDFIRDCRMVYDYTHQHIIVYNPSVRYAYVYSLTSQSWGMMQADIRDNVNAYPEALVMSAKKKTVTDPDGQEAVSRVSVLQDFTLPATDNVTILVVTRPFKMDDPGRFKTIDTIIQRGIFRRTGIQQVLHATNDFHHWHTVWSSRDMYLRGFRGTPYKAFRLAFVCRLHVGECLYGFTIQYTLRLLNRPR